MRWLKIKRALASAWWWFIDLDWGPIVLTVMVSVLLASLVGLVCIVVMAISSPTPPVDNTSYIHEVRVDMDGRQVTCLVWDPPGNAGSLWCDGGAK